MRRLRHGMPQPAQTVAPEMIGNHQHNIGSVGHKISPNDPAASGGPQSAKTTDPNYIEKLFRSC